MCTYSLKIIMAEGDVRRLRRSGQNIGRIGGEDDVEISQIQYPCMKFSNENLKCFQNTIKY